MFFEKEELESRYEMIKKYHELYLEKSGVKLPSLYNNKKYIKNALVLILLADNYPNTRPFSKKEIEDFLRGYYPDQGDSQQARHLAAQEGFYIVSGARSKSEDIPHGSYKLVSLEESYPDFKHERRQINLGTDEWDSLKAQYGYRCATCGSKQGEPHFHWRGTIVALQKGHMNPNLPLETGNIIPQCQVCNQADRDNWVYDAKGRVVQVNNPKIILQADENFQKELYSLLKEKYEPQ